MALSPDDVEWVTNDNDELGVKIGDQFFFLYKGYSLVYGESPKCQEQGYVSHDNGQPMRWRPVMKREFGECCHSVVKVDPRTVDWQNLPAAKSADVKAAAPTVTVHYKVSQTFNPRLDAHKLALCGADVSVHGTDVRHIPPCDDDCAQNVVTCETCLAIYAATRADP